MRSSLPPSFVTLCDNVSISFHRLCASSLVILRPSAPFKLSSLSLPKVSVNKLAGTAPSLNASAREPYFSVKASTSYPFPFKVLDRDASNLSDETPTLSKLVCIFSRFEVKAPSSKVFRASDVLLMKPLTTSDMPVHNSFACSKSPNTSLHV